MYDTMRMKHLKKMSVAFRDDIEAVLAAEAE